MTTAHATRPPAEPTRVPIGFLVVLLVAVVGVVGWMFDGAGAGAQPLEIAAETTAGTAAETTAGTAADTPAEEDAPTPVRVRIPTLDVAAPLRPLGLEADRSLEVPEDPAVAGWWTGGADPGERGPAVVVGHVDAYDGPGVFVDLHRLRPGDRVVIDREDGSSVHFEVRGLSRHPKDDFPTAEVYGATPGPTLRLVTCGGEFDRSARSYEDNVVVFLDVVGWS